MKNKILLIVVVILAVINCFLRSPQKETSFLIEDKILVKNTDNNKIESINIEEYLVGVLAGEMPASFEMEALKAQAVASRTYAYYKILTSDGEYDVTNDTSTQVHLTNEQMKEKWKIDYEYYVSKIQDAIKATKNEVLIYKGKIIPAYYFSMSNGYTENGQTVFGENGVYLSSVISKEDTSHRNFEVITVFEKDKFCKLLNIKCDSINISDPIRNSANRIDFITINGRKYTGIEIRKLLNLRSTDFTIEIEDSSINVTTFGHGHGVGMSQYGANNMAKEGVSYLNILKHYYTGLEIKPVSSIK